MTCKIDWLSVWQTISTGIEYILYRFDEDFYQWNEWTETMHNQCNNLLISWMLYKVLKRARWWNLLAQIRLEDIYWRYAYQLDPVFYNIFLKSLNLQKIPHLCKEAIVMPVGKIKISKNFKWFHTRCSYIIGDEMFW